MPAPSYFARKSYAPWCLEKLALLLGRLIYRVRTRGVEHLPAGGALVLANHVSYMDVVALQMSCPRPIRFVGHEELLDKGWFFQFLFRLVGVIPVSRSRAIETTRRVAGRRGAGAAVSRGRAVAHGTADAPRARV
jgi:acyl-[acyl-carrier-protein]-phospholipid O-acyltransferase/long-chain-fatty-acid--[acyl-carrier-protein] ligase